MNHIAEHINKAVLLKESTLEVHEKLDKTIMAHKPFASKANYLKFLTLQYYLMSEANGLYHNVHLIALFEELEKRNRLNFIRQDFNDLAEPLPLLNFEMNDTLHMNVPTAMGWLYVIEGSKLGAAMLGKEIGALDLSGTFGGRFLAGPGVGRGYAWRSFLQTLNDVELTKPELEQMVQGACDAFIATHLHLNRVFSRK